MKRCCKQEKASQARRNMLIKEYKWNATFKKADMVKGECWLQRGRKEGVYPQQDMHIISQGPVAAIRGGKHWSFTSLFSASPQAAFLLKKI